MSLDNEIINVRSRLEDGSEAILHKNINGGIANRVRKKTTLIEENNNEIDSLAVDLKNMGNITNKFKCKIRNNDCNESGDINFEVGEIHHDDLTIKTKETAKSNNKNEECANSPNNMEDDYSSDDFEDDVEEVEVKHSKPTKIQYKPSIIAKKVVSKKNNSPASLSNRDDDVKFVINGPIIPQCWQHSQSGHHFHHQLLQPRLEAENVQIIERVPSRVSSSHSGSVGKQNNRINMSFTNDRSKEIERENHILLKKILKSRHTKKPTTSTRLVSSRSSSATITRKRAQERIQHDNLILLRKIQGAKPSNLSLRK